ncbi:hypothetical protein BDQ17DRAFT_1545357 [Cyathus striatus]|nr:hypothetical protein BDQ17DRAFT_1545357 [Cyathus striatus]
MPRSNAKKVRNCETALLITELIKDITDTFPLLPNFVSPISSTVAKVLQISLTVMRNEDQIQELAVFALEVTAMVVERAEMFQVLESQLHQDIVELQKVLDQIYAMIEKFEKRNRFKAVLRANSDKEEIAKAEKQLAKLLSIFSAPRAVEIQHSAAETSKKVDILIVSARHTLDVVQGGDKGNQERIIIVMESSKKSHGFFYSFRNSISWIICLPFFF